MKSSNKTVEISKKELTAFSIVMGVKQEEICKGIKTEEYKNMKEFGDYLENKITKYVNNDDFTSLKKFLSQIMSLLLYHIPPEIRVLMFERALSITARSELKVKKMKELMKNESA